MIKLAVIDSDPQFAEEVGRLLDGRSDMTVAATAKDLNTTLIIAEQQRPEVMLFGPGMSAELSISFIKKLTAEYPIGCILLSLNPNEKLRAAAVKAGVVEVVRVPVEPEAIIASIHTAAEFAQQLTVKEDTAVVEHKCPVITVFSTKGGVGKTVLATNMAASIAKRTEGRVVLVDLDLQFGDVGIALGLSPERTVLEFMDRIIGEDGDKVDDLLIKHKSGARVLLAPKEPESADLITGECVSSIICALKSYADFIIFDTPASFNDNVLAVLDQTDEICLVLTMDMLSVKNIKLCLRTLNDLKYSREKQKLVVNRVESNVGLKVGEIEKVLGMRATAKIPSDKAIPLSLNKGVPVVVDSPKLPVSKEIEELAMFYVAKYQPDWIEMKMTG